MEVARAPPSAEEGRLKEKYLHNKQANSLLKKALLEKQADCAQLEQQLKEKEASLKQQLEEIDHLQFQNGRMGKQLQSLGGQAEELTRQTQQSAWSVQGFISGKQQQEAIQRMEGELRVLRDELVLKIQENEDLHMQQFETKKSQDEEADDLRRASNARSQELEHCTQELEAECAEAGRLTHEVSETDRLARERQGELSATAALVASLQETRERDHAASSGCIGELRRQVTRCSAFDARRHSIWSRHDASPQSGREQRWRKLAIWQLQLSVGESCGQVCSVLQAWAKTFSCSSDEEPAARLKIRNRVADATVRLADTVAGMVPGAVDAVLCDERLCNEGTTLLFAGCRCGSRGSSSNVVVAAIATEVGRSLSGLGEGADADVTPDALLQRHRKWVIYQCLLLSHDPDQSYGGRSAREEAQVASFVGCLWRLHGCIRQLLRRLRLFAGVLALATNGIVNGPPHYALCRSSLRQDGEEAGAWGPRAARPDGGPAHGVPLTAAAEGVRSALASTARCIEGIGRCLSAWAAVKTAAASEVKASQPVKGSLRDETKPPATASASAVELLEALHRLSSCVSEKVPRSLEGVVHNVLRQQPQGTTPQAGEQRRGGGGQRPLLPDEDQRRTAPSSVARHGSATNFLSRAGARLRTAPPVIGFESAVQTQQLLRRSSGTRRGLSAEAAAHQERLCAAMDERQVLSGELRALQDAHALLHTNLRVLRVEACAEGDKTPGAHGSVDVIAVSRGRAAVELPADDDHSESAGELPRAPGPTPCRSHLVDSVGLFPGEVQAAIGPPAMEGSQAWELLVRERYEQHLRNLAQLVRDAGGRAAELQVGQEQGEALVRQQEEAQGSLRGELRARESELSRVKEEETTTRKNYEDQLFRLTEHVHALSLQLSEKDAQLASVQARRVLCSRCGAWSAVGHLLAPGADGLCRTCRGRVLAH